MASSTDNSTFQFTGKHMLAIMIAFFSVIIVVNFTMATMASRSWTGLVVKNSYVASQQYNGHLQQAEAQRKLGWRSAVSYTKGELTFALQDKQGEPVMLNEVAVHAGRPAFEQLDTVTPLQLTAGGTGTARLALADGEWMLRIEAQAGEQFYRRDVRIMVTKGTGDVE